MANGLPGGTRWVDVAPDRLTTWLESFAERHGGLAQPPEPAPADGRPAESGVAAVTFRAADGALAQCHVPFPPLPPASPASPAGPAGPGGQGGPAGPGGEPAASAAAMAAHATADRTVGVLLVRLGGYAAGVFTGTDQHLAASKVGSRLVHGRSAAGGTSQRRFARRREKQASEALGAAAGTAAAVFGPFAGRLDAVVLGGDRRAMAGLARDPRLRPYLDLAVDRFLTVPDPRLAVLKGTPRMFCAIRVRLAVPEPPAPPGPAAPAGPAGPRGG